MPTTEGLHGGWLTTAGQYQGLCLNILPQMDNFFLFVCLYEICDFYIPFENTSFWEDLAQMQEALAWGLPILEIRWT